MHDEELAFQEAEAERRYGEREAERLETIAVLAQPGGIAFADTPERVAKRADRLMRYYAGEELPQRPADVPVAAPEELLANALERAPIPTEASAPEEERAGVVLEAIINTRDFVDIRYLESGVSAARAVCRVLIRDDAGRTRGFGTGSLVSPRLLLTNHHVLPDAATAAASAAEFNFQDGLDGQPLQSRVLRLDPQSFFLADRKRDFALVAVRGSESDLRGFGFNRLIEAEGKAVKGEFVTIVQHPRGEKKQVALRENRILDLLETFVHYEADTEPGSSGSPVFNDQWEVVALHHASAPARMPGEHGRFLNEGVRISRILRFVRDEAPATARDLVDQLFEPERILLPQAAGPPDGGRPADVALDLSAAPDPPSAEPPAVAAGGEARLTVPLELTIRFGSPTSAELPPPTMAIATHDPDRPALPDAEAIRIDPDYRSRRGYDADFLARNVPLPTLPPKLLAEAARRTDGGGELLPYHHFTLVMNRQRRLAFYTACNIDGRESRRLKRERDRWFPDPRIHPDEQTNEALYAKNKLDRGHLVRRLDPAWGRSETQAKLANDDTFHFTNCSPQHEDFNQNRTTWAGLEDYILENADNKDFKVTVFTGPLFADDDDDYRGLKLPRQFWKVAVMVKTDGTLSATAYLLSQEQLLSDLEAVSLENFSYAAYRTFQVPVARIEVLSQLSFGRLSEHDPLARQEATTFAQEISRPEDLQL